jgi:hypothetical protein
LWQTDLRGYYLRCLSGLAKGLEVKFKRKVLVIALMVGLFSAPTAQAKAPTFHMSAIAFAKQSVRDTIQFKCLVKLWTRESRWNYLAKNKVPVYQIRDGKRVALHAFGIAQLLGETSQIPYIQIQNGLKYLKRRYGNSPCRALHFHLRHNWY